MIQMVKMVIQSVKMVVLLATLQLAFYSVELLVGYLLSSSQEFEDSQVLAQANNSLRYLFLYWLFIYVISRTPIDPTITSPRLPDRAVYFNIPKRFSFVYPATTASTQTEDFLSPQR